MQRVAGPSPAGLREAERRESQARDLFEQARRLELPGSREVVILSAAELAAARRERKALQYRT